MKNLIVILVALIALNSSAKEQALGRTMKELGQTMESLFPYLFNDAKFKSKKNERKIELKLKRLQSLFALAKPHFEKRSSNFKISYNVINKHLSETREVFRGNKDFSLNMIKTIPSMCVSCHTQDSRHGRAFKDLKRSSFKSDFEFAEFNFMTRNYKRALKYYDSFISTPQKKSEFGRVNEALKRKLTIFAKVYKDPNKGIHHFEKLLKSKNLSELQKSDIKSWIAGLKEWSKKDDFKLDASSFSDIKKYVEKKLGKKPESGPFVIEGKEKIIYIRLAGVLHQYLNGNPKQSEIPQLLYWLSLCDRALNYSFFYSLADLYLKECLTNYNKDPFARRCYDEYKNHVLFSFTGSRGTELPEDIKKELQDFDNLLKKP